MRMLKKKKKSFFNHSLPPNSDLFFLFTSLSHALSAHPLTVNASPLSRSAGRLQIGVA